VALHQVQDNASPHFVKTIFMKNILTLILIGLLAIPIAKGQEIERAATKSPIEIDNMYIKKCNANNIISWATTSSEIAMVVTGASINLADFRKHVLLPNYFSNKGLWLCYDGAATTIASHPFFNWASENMKKASMALKREAITIGNKNIIKSNYLAVALSIHL
jgi:hypothetical protein